MNELLKIINNNTFRCPDCLLIPEIKLKYIKNFNNNFIKIIIKIIIKKNIVFLIKKQYEHFHISSNLIQSARKSSFG